MEGFEECASSPWGTARQWGASPLEDPRPLSSPIRDRRSIFDKLRLFQKTQSLLPLPHTQKHAACFSRRGARGTHWGGAGGGTTN